MGFDRILGQAAAVETLERALRTGNVHHAYRFEGPNGVGKEMAAFGFAQALVCTTEPPLLQARRACGRCSACVRAVTLSSEAPCVPLHPDVVLLERGLYSPRPSGGRGPSCRTSPSTKCAGWCSSERAFVRTREKRAFTSCDARTSSPSRPPTRC